MTDKNKITNYCLKQIVWRMYTNYCSTEKYGGDFYQAVAYCDIVRTFNKQGHDMANRAIAFGGHLFKKKDEIEHTFQSIDNLPGMQEIYDMVQSLTNV